jgi:hypothetical protein
MSFKVPSDLPSVVRDRPTQDNFDELMRLLRHMKEEIDAGGGGGPTPLGDQIKFVTGAVEKFCPNSLAEQTMEVSAGVRSEITITAGDTAEDWLLQANYVTRADSGNDTRQIGRIRQDSPAVVVGIGQAQRMYFTTTNLAGYSMVPMQCKVTVPAGATRTYYVTAACGGGSFGSYAFSIGAEYNSIAAIRFKGAKGDVGATGPQGPPGVAGPTGAPGFGGPEVFIGPTAPVPRNDLIVWVDSDAPGLSTIDKNYVHTQLSLASTWTVTHGLAKYPAVDVVDTGDSTVMPNVHYDDLNTVTLTFAAPTSGKAFVN